MREKIVFVLIFVLAVFFRFYGLNWDQNQHLHPDERFLTMVGNAMKVPENIFGYLDPRTSTFNPANVNYTFFVYGIFPVTLNKLTAVLLNNDTYNNFTLQGRFLSGISDIFVVLLVFKTVELLERRFRLSSSLKYWASFFYAISLLPIQLSHFFAVDTFLNLFMFASFYFALRFSLENTWSDLALSAFLFGLAIASKITALFILPLNLIFIGTFVFHGRIALSKFISSLRFLGFYFLIIYLTVRIADPYLFEHANILNPQISKTFISNLISLKSFEGKDVWYPPAVQWLDKQPIVFGLRNIIFFGVGIPYFILMLLGLYKSVRKGGLWGFVLLWVLAFFIYQSTQFANTMRYFIFLYPFFAIFAAVGSYSVVTFVRKYFSYWYVLVVLVLIGSVLVWPLAFLSIYTKNHSRVLASEWMYKTLENGSLILGEHWDDPLPLLVRNYYGKQFTVELLPVFNPDTPEKWEKMEMLLVQADYYVLSSNRGWGSITTVPEKYPRMSKFYEDLLAENLSYKKIAEFTSYPSLRYLGIPIDFSDDWAEEAFTVYDHPKVIIFAKQK